MAPEFGKSIHQLPLIPADVVKKHRVHEPLDTRFRSAARLLQALWREDRGFPIGSYVSEDGKRRKLGSRIFRSGGTGRRQFPHLGIAKRHERGRCCFRSRLGFSLLPSRATLKQ